MQHDSLPSITDIDWFLQRQAEIDCTIIERMRENQQVAQVWGLTVSIRPTDHIVESTLSEVRDART